MTVSATSLLRLTLLGVVLAGCAQSGGPSTPPGPAVRLAFVKDTFVVNQTRTLQLRAVGYDANDMPVPDLAIEYSVSGAAASATVAGLVSGLGPGVGVLQAHAGTLGAIATLEVFGHPEGVVVGSTPLGSRPFGVAVSREGVVYVTQLDNAQVVELDTSLAVTDSVAVGAVPTAVTFSPDGLSAFVTNQYSQNVGVIDVGSGSQVRTIAIPADPFVPFVSPDGSRLFITSNTSSVYIADAVSGTLTDSIELSHAPNGFALHPELDRVFVSTFVGGTVSELDVSNGHVRRTFTPGGQPQDMVVSTDGKELYVANESGWVDMYDLASGTLLEKVTLAGGGFGMALSPDLEHLYVSEPNVGKLQIINIATRAVIHTLDVGGSPRRVAFTRHGGVAVIPNEAGYVSFVK